MTSLEARWARWRRPHLVLLHHLAWLLLLWGGWITVLEPWATSSAFAPLAWASERSTGAVLGGVAVVALWLLRRGWRAQAAAGIVLAAAWAYICVLLALGNVRSTGVLVYGALTIWSVRSASSAVELALAHHRGDEDA